MGKYDSILLKIDQAIEAGIAAPGSLTDGNQSIQYRNLKDLLDARQYYARLNSRPASGLSTRKISGGSLR